MVRIISSPPQFELVPPSATGIRLSRNAPHHVPNLSSPPANTPRHKLGGAAPKNLDNSSSCGFRSLYAGIMGFWLCSLGLPCMGSWSKVSCSLTLGAGLLHISDLALPSSFMYCPSRHCATLIDYDLLLKKSISILQVNNKCK